MFPNTDEFLEVALVTFKGDKKRIEESRSAEEEEEEEKEEEEGEEDTGIV